MQIAESALTGRTGMLRLSQWVAHERSCLSRHCQTADNQGDCRSERGYCESVAFISLNILTYMGVYTPEHLLFSTATCKRILVLSCKPIHNCLHFFNNAVVAGVGKVIAGVDAVFHERVGPSLRQLIYTPSVIESRT